MSQLHSITKYFNTFVKTFLWSGLDEITCENRTNFASQRRQTEFWEKNVPYTMLQHILQYF